MKRKRAYRATPVKRVCWQVLSRHRDQPDRGGGPGRRRRGIGQARVLAHQLVADRRRDHRLGRHHQSPDGLQPAFHLRERHHSGAEDQLSAGYRRRLVRRCFPTGSTVRTAGQAASATPGHPQPARHPTPPAPHALPDQCQSAVWPSVGNSQHGPADGRGIVAEQFAGSNPVAGDHYLFSFSGPQRIDYQHRVTLDAAAVGLKGHDQQQLAAFHRRVFHGCRGGSDDAAVLHLETVAALQGIGSDTVSGFRYFSRTIFIKEGEHAWTGRIPARRYGRNYAC